MVVSLVSKTIAGIFGSRNDRLIKAYRNRVEQINAVEQEVRILTDAELRAKTREFQNMCASGTRISQIMPQVMATAREVMDRAVGIRNIFNPEAGFDRNRLPEKVREAYDQVVRKAAELAPIEEQGCQEPIPGWMQVEIPISIYNAVRELFPKSRPPFRARPFDVQLIGGMVLGEGRIAEMKTGEGKTIVAPLACYVACVEALQCHVVTVNDYLVQRDRDWVFPFYYWLGLTVGAIHPFHMQPSEEKQKAYHCNVVYGTNSEFGFDYLRDNMKLTAEEQVQRHRDFCIVDEIDSILIDEARTPLIISGPAHDDAPRYGMADGVARHLMQKQRDWDAADEKVRQCVMRIKGYEGDIRNARDKAKVDEMREQMKQLQEQLPALEAERDKFVQYYEVEREKKASHLTHEGVAEAQKVAGIGSFYVGNNMDFPHLLENALRAHAVYQRDKDYVVQNGEVIIVDEFTGRLMIGRQWSDGLHQAVESKERVKIKQETQTLATVTIQNFFKLYKRLAGMTGTAITEAVEFNDIYRLDVVCIPTNLPVIRKDYDDLIYLSQKDKWTAILDEIKHHHDIGRPVLVGTTSVENSEMLSQLLTRRHGIQHEVLNAKQHEREAQIVEHAGQLGAVMIATNMAGRGTDIKLTPIDRALLIRHWQQRNLLPRDAKPEMSDAELIDMAYRHIAVIQLGMKPKDLEGKCLDELRLMLLRHWTTAEGWKVGWPAFKWWEKVLLYKYFVVPAWHDPQKIAAMSEQQLLEVLDRLPNFMQHRLRIFPHIEELGGLHIVGTERHESRRIDNQLRGRAGRQGDRGSSRFFISLEDDLMKMFAGKTTLTALSKLGMKEGDAIEHRWLTRSVERAQRKVEERNFEIRKNLLEYDEVMEHQRNHFYSIRQAVLEGRQIQELIFDYIGQAVDEAVATYLNKDYVAGQIAEWCRQTLDVSVDSSKLHTDDIKDLHETIRRESRAETVQIIDVTIGEYMSHDLSPDEWDLRGLAGWAMSRFSVDLKQNQLREMNIEQVKTLLGAAAIEQVDRKDLSGVNKFLDPLYAEKQLVDWCRNKFGIEFAPEKVNRNDPDQVVAGILEQARASYARREITYPIEFVLDMVFQAAKHDGPWAAAQLSAWVKQRYELDIAPEEIAKLNGQELRTRLVEAAEQWVSGGDGGSGDRMAKLVDDAIARHSDPEALAKWASERFARPVTAEELSGDDRREVLLHHGRMMLRAELTQLERYVLLQILDMAWKDHLYAMDQLKDSVGLRGYAEKDPRIEYKREGASQFREMERIVRDRVTDLIFRARLTADFEARSVYGESQARHEEAQSLTSAAAGAAQYGTDEQRQALAAATQAGDRDSDAHLSRKQRRARAAGKHDDAGHGSRERFKQRKRRR